MTDFKLLKTIDVGNELGEGIVWDDQQQKLMWTDIHGKALYIHDLDRDQTEKFDLPHRLCSFGLTNDSDTLITAFDIGLARFTVSSKAIEWLAKPEEGYVGTRFNDGRVDRQGRFWAGTMVEGDEGRDEDGNPVAGSLYCLEGDKCTRHVQDVQISNSLCWSLDSKTVYYADSPSGEIRQYPFDASGPALGDPTVFAKTKSPGSPDGSTIDSEGCLWNAEWGAGRVVRYLPDGRYDTSVSLPTIQPTCPSFAGPDLSWLCVTTATEGMSAAQLAEQPKAGSVFIFETPFKGVPEGRVALTRA